LAAARHGAGLDREGALKAAAAVLALGLTQAAGPSFAVPTEERYRLSNSTKASRHRADFADFERSLFNKPPTVITYPDWLEGEWSATMLFVGAKFPVLNDPKVKLTESRIMVGGRRDGAQRGGGKDSRCCNSTLVLSPSLSLDLQDDTSLPGFRRLSVAMLPDIRPIGGAATKMRLRLVKVGGPGEGALVAVGGGPHHVCVCVWMLCRMDGLLMYRMYVDVEAVANEWLPQDQPCPGVVCVQVEDEAGARVVEDKNWDLLQSMEGELGEGAVKAVEYDPAVNPNRATISLKSGASPNAQRIGA
jgi:hypothetical protein